MSKAARNRHELDWKLALPTALFVLVFAVLFLVWVIINSD